MNYVFVFLGEFGYELLNWQGVVRKFSKTIDRSKDKIIICSRKGLEPFYEFAHRYIDISKLKYFKKSIANMYWSHNPKINMYKHEKEVREGLLDAEFHSRKDNRFRKKLKKQIINYAYKKCGLNIITKLFHKEDYMFIFSCDYQTINGCEFGSTDFFHPFIYSDLKLDNNEFVQVHADKNSYCVRQAREK